MIRGMHAMFYSSQAEGYAHLSATSWVSAEPMSAVAG